MSRAKGIGPPPQETAKGSGPSAGLVVAIDGPGGAGKSTVSARVGARLSLPHLDTGAYYRAATLLALRAGLDLADGLALAREAARHRFELEGGRMVIDGHDESVEIRSAAVTAAVSQASAKGKLRHLMVERQRRWVEEHGGSAVVEGRDIGTVVFPAAVVKVFLSARPEVRAQRRAEETASAAGAVEADLARRDRYDSSRSESPLKAADGAVHLDTSDLSIDEVVDRIVAMVEAVRG